MGGHIFKTIPIFDEKGYKKAMLRFQFSLREMLAAVLAFGSLLTFLHTREGVHVGVWQQAVIGAVFFCAIGFGGWWSARKGERGWRRIVRAAILVFVALIVWTLLQDRIVYYCVRCGAKRTDSYGVLCSVEEGEVPQRIRTITGQPCLHHWSMHTRSFRLGGHGDGSAWQNTPVLLFSLPDALERIPRREWAVAAIDAMGDRDNLLRFPAAMVIANLGFEPPTDESGWQTWWATYGPVFQRVTKPEVALPIAQAAVDNLAKPPGRSWYVPFFGDKVVRELPGLKLPP
ncbi:MAG TPA: hypothetical protein VGP72_26570 [Planctomycetota bacterium]|jgi:hypothetical protein